MTTFNKILIGIDNSKYAEHAAKTGFDLARTFGAHVGLVHIVEPAYIPAPVADSTIGMPLDTTINPAVEMEIINAQDQVSGEMINATIRKYAGDLEVTNYTDYGSTADGILNCCNEFNADLIVIGTHSRTGIDRLFMGSVAESVIRHASVPVLVVPFAEEK